MAIAGYCKSCGQNVYLNDQWGCVNGHAWSEVTNWYDPQGGTAVTPYWLQQPAQPENAAVPAAPSPAPTPSPAPAPAPAADERALLLDEIMSAFSAYPGYRLAYGTDTDIAIDNQVADANWGTGKKNVDFSAILKAVEPERTVYYWEILKEKGAGLSFGGFSAETYSTSGTKRVGEKKEVVIGPGGRATVLGMFALVVGFTALVLMILFGAPLSANLGKTATYALQAVAVLVVLLGVAPAIRGASMVGDYTWDYSQTRHIVESVAAARGWRVKTVLNKKSAQW